MSSPTTACHKYDTLEYIAEPHITYLAPWLMKYSYAFKWVQDHMSKNILQNAIQHYRKN